MGESIVCNKPEMRSSFYTPLKLQLHDAIYRLRFYSNSLIHILSLSNSHNNVAQKNRGDKSNRVIVALFIVVVTIPKVSLCCRHTLK